MQIYYNLRSVPVHLYKPDTFVRNETTMLKSHFSAIWESVADAVPEHIALIQGERRMTWRDYESRSAKLAQGLMEAGLGKHAKVGMYLYNSPEYAETNFAALKIGGVPINVNYRYLYDELFYLLENADV